MKFDVELTQDAWENMQAVDDGELRWARGLREGDRHVGIVLEHARRSLG